MATVQSVTVSATALEQQERERLLPVVEELEPLFPLGGLRRGSMVAVKGSTAVLLRLLAAATTEGSWVAVVGMPDLGVVAASELGVSVQRLVAVAGPDASRAAGVIAALLDGMDLVVVAAGVPVTTAQQRRLAARARSRGAVLVTREMSWPGTDIELCCSRVRWSGLERGHGYLRSWQLAVTAQGRGAASRPVRVQVSPGAAA